MNQTEQLSLLHKGICPNCMVKRDFWSQMELSVPQTVTCCECGSKFSWWPPGFSTEEWTLRPDLLKARPKQTPTKPKPWWRVLFP